MTDVVDLGGQLRLVDPNQPDPTEEMGTLEFVDSDMLRIADDTGYGSPGELVRYVRDADGAVTKVTFGGVSAVPIEAHVEALQGIDRISLGGPHAAG